ncbi:LysR family transcriptional regulator (plasmid) [Paracoccus marcusii]|uniref:helix-turn-helix domain-containing protein n=1 Tax=Paracoccus marcusii TaxID=59779 RepID=UPI0038BB4C59
MECFETGAPRGSVGAAATELGVITPAVRQQIRLLEAPFGIRLFPRDRHKRILTHDAEQLRQATLSDSVEPTTPCPIPGVHGRH